MGIFFAILAAVLASVSNLCMRKSIDAGGSSKAYLVVQVSLSFVAMIFLNPVRTGDYDWNTLVVLLGLIEGILLGVLMWGVGKSLETGPAGLSFAFLNSSSVMPALLLFLIYGVAYGHTYTIANGVGSLLVVSGLFWAGWTSKSHLNRWSWVFYVLLIFVVHTLFLAYLQWWAMVLDPNLPLSILLPFHVSPLNIQWFMPAVLFVAALFQWVIYFSRRNRFPKGSEIIYGIIGGITNGVCTFFLILAPQVASPWQNAMIFPIFSVGIIILCNLWAQALYNERINWLANGLCLLGILVGTIVI